MAKVDVISSCVIRMEGSSTNPISRLDPTPWDLQMLSLDYCIQKGILFQKPQSQQTLIPHLKASLSRTLSTSSLRSPAASPPPPTTTARSASSSTATTPESITSFFADIGSPNSEGASRPLLAVQVTELVDGVFIALTANHVAVDGVSFWHFFNSWSEISRGSDTISKTPVFEHSVRVRNSPLRLPPLEKSSYVLPPPTLLERVFHFSKQTLSNLKAKANSEAGTDKVSSLQVMSAHLWQALSRHRYSGISLDDLIGREDPLAMVVGSRPRMPLPELVREGIGHVAAKINELVARHTKDAIVKMLEDWVECPAVLRRGSFSFLISSTPRHDVYVNDFGWGKPVAVRSGPTQKFDGKMTLFPSVEGGGIDVEVCLATETLQAVEHDAEFMEAFAV
ncbi:hypothetical protein AAHA92_01937 [Salvia divinorum]|uniref:HXXXD-type acyl-transferase family protein n=1 Tax=Salvia divinorum TaxID=28513 RepID=A0ABD1IEQ9_SALDI